MDLDLLRGFRFECRPDCGLCCFAEPAATAPERERLIQLEPALRWVPEESGLERLGARADGGACQLLSASRCRAHAARPYPCRAFPVHVHIGERVQASLVLACPGLQWNSGTGGLGQGAPPRGLESELEAVLQEATSSPLDALRADAASRLQRWLRRHRLSEEAWHGLREGVLEPILRGEEPERSLDLAPPPIVDPLEERAIFWEQGTGVVLLATDADGAYDLSVPRESGGIAQRLGSLAPPAAAPRLTPDGQSALRGYLEYLLRRDQFHWSLLAEFEPATPEELGEMYPAALSAVRRELLTRAAVRARLRGAPGDRLDASDVERGIRALDNDLLDRPTLGSIL